MKWMIFSLFLFCCTAVNAQDTTITRVEETFIGGDASWRNFIQQNIDNSVPGKNKAPIGNYLVEVGFYVDTTGRLINIKPITHKGYGMEAEVIRLLKKSPKWSPARENGRPVRVYRKQQVLFSVQ
jgi:protein TonB